MDTFVVQINAGSDKSANLEQATSLVDEGLKGTSPDIIALPENWMYLGGDLAGFKANAETLPPQGSGETGGQGYEWLRSLAHRHRSYVHGGSLIERDGDRLFNTSLVFDREGHEVARYRKIHLFDVVTPGGVRYAESEIVGHGEKVVTFKLDDAVAGCAICYDVRFPELFRALRDAGSEVIFLPAAFTLQTGKDHWDPLLRARAIETQCWLVAAATWGDHRDAQGGIRKTFGNSLVCDPWGQVVARASDGTGSVRARIDRSLTARVRQDLPVASHHRLV